MRVLNAGQSAGRERQRDVWAWLRLLIVATACALMLACSPLRLGQPFKTNPTKIKIGYDSRKDVEAKMGLPYRVTHDNRGQDVLSWIWADGKGRGEKCIVVVNKNDVVSLVEVVH